MGDRVDLWGGLPERPEPYFTAQRRKGWGRSPWARAEPPRRLRGIEEFSERDRLGAGRVPVPARAVPRTRRPRRRVSARLAIALAAACAAVALTGADAVTDGALRARLARWEGRAWHPGFAVARIPEAYRDVAGSPHSVLAVSGPFGAAAGDLVAEALDEASPAPGDTVALSSEGGDLAQGIAIGAEVRRRGLYTVVGAYGAGRFVPSYCVGACVAAFAGGVHRMQAVGSLIGLRAATAAESGAMQAHLAAMGVAPPPVAAQGGGVAWVGAATAIRANLADIDIPGL